MSDEYEFSDLVCPFCGHEPTHVRDCPKCEEGFIDCYDEDPLWYDEDEFEVCLDCHGTWVQHWCLECGKYIYFGADETEDEGREGKS